MNGMWRIVELGVQKIQTSFSTKLRRRKMIKLIKKFFNLFRPKKIVPEVIEKCGVHVARFKKSCPRCQQLNQSHGQVW
jgi:uncharacterized OB-fold protein